MNVYDVHDEEQKTLFPERRLCQDVDKVPDYSAYGCLYHENEEYFLQGCLYDEDQEVGHSEILHD